MKRTMNKKQWMFKVLIFIFAVACAAALHAEKQNATVKIVEGWAEFALPGSQEFQPLTPSTILPHGSTVKTSEGASVIVRVVPGAAMNIAENTTVVLDGMEFAKEGEEVKTRKARIKLSAGTVSALLDHRNPKATDFRIETPQGSAAARGTFYGVSVTDGQTFVSVKEGKVGVTEKKKDDAAPAAADAKKE